MKKVPKADSIYIDGNHEYDFVKKDLENYYPKLKDGGILAGDDFQIPNVRRAVLQFCCKNNILPDIKGTEWILHSKNNLTIGGWKL